MLVKCKCLAPLQGHYISHMDWLILLHTDFRARITQNRPNKGYIEGNSCFLLTLSSCFQRQGANAISGLPTSFSCKAHFQMQT